MLCIPVAARDLHRGLEPGGVLNENRVAPLKLLQPRFDSKANHLPSGDHQPARAWNLRRLDRRASKIEQITVTDSEIADKTPFAEIAITGGVLAAESLALFK